MKIAIFIIVLYCDGVRGKMAIMPVVHAAMGCRQKSFKLVWWCHQLLSWFLVNDHLPRVSLQSRLSANDKGDNEIIPRTVLRSPGIYLKAEENPGKSQLGINFSQGLSRSIFFSGVLVIYFRQVYCPL